jgi:hypothetical protein
MPFPTGSGSKSEVDHKLKSKRQQIIEEERIRLLGDSFISFYDKLMEKYELSYPEKNDELEAGEDSIKELVPREEVEKYAREFADTKPTGY